MNQREIKFRLWDSIDKKMSAPFKLGAKEVVDVYGVYMTDLTDIEYPGFIVVQFTGLLDQNKKEICQGDIVKVKHSLYEIEFSRGMFNLANNIVGLYPLDAHVLEIIGNIYENPELLK